MKSNLSRIMSVVILSSAAVACSPAEKQESAQPVLAENRSGDSSAAPQEQRSVASSETGSSQESAKEESPSEEESFDLQEYLEQQREERQANTERAAAQRQESEKRQQQLELLMLVSQMNLMKQGLKLAGGEGDFDLFEIPESLKVLMGLETSEKKEETDATDTQEEASTATLPAEAVAPTTSVSESSTVNESPEASTTKLNSSSVSTEDSPSGVVITEAAKTPDSVETELSESHEDCQDESASDAETVSDILDQIRQEIAAPDHETVAQN